MLQSWNIAAGSVGSLSRKETKFPKEFETLDLLGKEIS